MKSSLLAVIVASAAATANATPLEMFYTVTDAGGGLYNYEFTLRLTNGDGTWAPGQGFGWLIWGDQREAASPLSDFIGDQSDFPVGPFQCYAYSSGYHNGPGFCVVEPVPPYPLVYWRPTQVGDELHWSGTSARRLEQGEMLWSNLVADSGATYSEWNVGTLEEDDSCPADFDGDGFVTGLDFDAYVAAFEAGDISADFDGDGFVTGLDFDEYVAIFESGCD